MDAFTKLREIGGRIFAGDRSVRDLTVPTVQVGIPPEIVSALMRRDGGAGVDLELVAGCLLDIQMDLQKATPQQIEEIVDGIIDTDQYISKVMAEQDEWDEVHVPARQQGQCRLSPH